MSFIRGLLQGTGDAMQRAEAERRAAARQASLEEALKRAGPMTHGPDGTFGDVYGGREEGGSPFNPTPRGGAGAGPAPEAPASTFDPRRGVFANGARTSYSPTQNRLASLIDATEGGGRFDTLFGYAQRPGGGDNFDGIDVSRMTIGQLKEFSAPSGEYGQWVKEHVGRVATPMGRHQIVGTTLRRTADAMGLSDDTVFSPAVQDSMFEHLAMQRLSAARNPAAKRAQLRLEWEGFKHVDDTTLDQAIADFEAQNRGPGRAMM